MTDLGPLLAYLATLVYLTGVALCLLLLVYVAPEEDDGAPVRLAYRLWLLFLGLVWPITTWYVLVQLLLQLRRDLPARRGISVGLTPEEGVEMRRLRVQDQPVPDVTRDSAIGWTGEDRGGPS